MTDTSYAIEKDIPAPEYHRHRIIYPLGQMAVGDSFPLKDDPSLRELERVRSAVSLYGRRHPPMKFSVRRIDPKSRNYRCWRIA